MLFAPSFVDGEHVKVRRDVPGWLGYPAVRKGARGVVVQVPGWFSDHYLVSVGGRRVSISGTHLRQVLVSSTGNDIRAGVRLGMFVFLFAIPAIGVIRYLIGGGSLSGLVAALPGAVIGTIVAVVGRGLHLLGLPLFALVRGGTADLAPVTALAGHAASS